MNSQKLMSPDDLAEIMGTHRDRVEQWLKENKQKIDVYEVDGELQVDPLELSEHLSNRLN